MSSMGWICSYQINNDFIVTLLSERYACCLVDTGYCTGNTYSEGTGSVNWYFRLEVVMKFLMDDLVRELIQKYSIAPMMTLSMCCVPIFVKILHSMGLSGAIVLEVHVKHMLINVTGWLSSCWLADNHPI